MEEKKLDGKTIIITGANCGIGYETALDLAKRDARVILACRDETKGREAVEKIKAETKNDNVELELLDLASFTSIKAFCERIKAKLQRLDILVNNAGLSGVPYKKTEEGFELHFGVMHLGHFLLTNLLLDLLKKSAPSRIINVSSLAHKGIDMNWDDLQSEKSYSSMFCYRQAKLANILFTVELAKRLKDSGVCAVSLHPGGVNTSIFRERDDKPLSFKILHAFLIPIVYLFGKSSKEGAQTTIHCCISDEIPNQNGSYFDNSRVASASRQATNPESAKRLWEISCKLVNIDA